MTVTTPMRARRIGAAMALAVSGLLVAGCGKEPIFESVATSNTGKNAAMSLSIPVPARPLSGCSYTNEAVGLAASDDRQKTAGPSGTASWSLPGTDQWVGVTIEIKRPPDSGPVVQ